MEFTDAVGFKAFSNRGEMRWARVGGGPVLVSQDGAVIWGTTPDIWTGVVPKHLMSRGTNGQISNIFRAGTPNI